MTGRVDGKVALITGAARGQGRAHALRLADEGADIIAVDICAPLPGVTYPSATPQDLATTVAEVEKRGRRIVSAEVDTRDLDELRDVVTDGVRELGGLHVVIANAGICIPAAWHEVSAQMFRDTIDVNLVGTWNTVMASAPHMLGNGGSIILTSSVAGLKGLPFLVPYVASKHGVTGLARAFAHELAKDHIRVNSVHPTGVDTPMGTGDLSDAIQRGMEANPRIGPMFTNSIPVDVVEAVDVSNAVLFLASDESRYVTAMALTVDAGSSQF